MDRSKGFAARVLASAREGMSETWPARIMSGRMKGERSPETDCKRVLVDYFA